MRPSKPWEDAGGTLTEVTAFEGHWSPTPWEPSTDRQTQQWPTLQPSYQQSTLHKSAREGDRRSPLPNLKTCKLAARAGRQECRQLTAIGGTGVKSRNDILIIYGTSCGYSRHSSPRGALPSSQVPSGAQFTAQFPTPCHGRPSHSPSEGKL